MFWAIPPVAVALFGAGIGIMAALGDVAKFFIMIGVFPTMAGLCLGLLWVMTATPLVLVYVASAILTAVEFVVRRFAEYPKGPMVALSALVAAFAGLIKIFTK